MPSVIEAVRTCIDAGAPGHHRASARRRSGTSRPPTCTRSPTSWRRCKGRVEFNIEGDPRPGFLELVLAVKPDQCTLVPVKPGEITSEAGWPADTPADALAGIIGALKAAGVRVSLFVDPEPAAIRWAKTMGADRVELYTEPFARAFERGPGCGGRELREVRRAPRTSRIRARRRRQCRTRSRSEEPDAVQDAAAPRRSVDRPRADQPRDLRRPRPGREGIPRRAVAGAAVGRCWRRQRGSRRHAASASRRPTA